MEVKSKYTQLLKPLLCQPLFTAADAEKKGIPRQALAYFEKMGVIERPRRGIYRSVNHESEIELSLEGLALAAYATSNSVISLISALYYYNLTDEIPREHWLAIPNSQKAPPDQSIRAVRMRNIEMGKMEVQIGEYKLAIYNRERCIVDAFRYLSPEIAIKSLKFYLDTKPTQLMLRRLEEYGKKLRVNLRPYLLSLMV